MKSINWIKTYAVTGLLAFGLFGCSTDADEQEIAQDAKLTQTEFQTILETDQWTGAADSAIAELYQNGNTNSGKFLSNDCYEATYTETGFTATFGNCVLNGTENVNGTLVVTYGLDQETASFTASFDGFFVGDIELNGTRTYSMQVGNSANSFALQVSSDMTVILADGEEISESGTKTVEFTFGETLEDSGFNITGSWTLNIGGNTYSVTVESPLSGNFGCAYLVSGMMELSKNGLMIDADLGDGTCDNIVVITYPNGAKEELTL